MHQVTFPKISLITPVYNQVTFLEETIRSVITQNYPNLEYIIIDGGSTDGTLEIIKKYEKRISWWLSEPDSGMYEALNKGFLRSTGQIMGWINSDDLLLPGSLNRISKLFTDLPQVSWIQGLNSYIDLEGSIVATHSPRKFSFPKFLNKEYKFIQQESTFWRRKLWEDAGGTMDMNLKLAGDFELWFRFFQFERLYNTSVPMGAWRRREGQLSGTKMKDYIKEANCIIDSFLLQNPQPTLKKIKFIEKFIFYLRMLPFLNLNYLEERKNKLLKLEKVIISYSYDKQKFILK